MGKSLKIYEYNGKKGKYKITYIDGQPFFVIIRSDNFKGEMINRVNLKTLKEYKIYSGEYTIINDLVIIG